MMCHCNMYVVHYKPSVCDVMKHGWKNEDERLQQCHADPCLYTHTHTHDYFDSLFFLTKKPEWNSWTTLFGRNDGCWSLVGWPYMHLRHWRCCGRRRRWAPPTPPSYILPGLGIGWWSGQRLTAGYGGHSIHTSEGGVDVDESVSLSSLCVCVCVCL